MLILRDTDTVAELENGLLRQLIQQRIEEIGEHSPWDADELGPFIIVESGDTDADIEAETGCRPYSPNRSAIA